MESNVPSIIAFETMFEFCPPVYSLQFIIFLHYLQINIGLKIVLLTIYVTKRKSE